MAPLPDGDPPGEANHSAALAIGSKQNRQNRMAKRGRKRLETCMTRPPYGSGSPGQSLEYEGGLACNQPLTGL
jgi:hypothetical protein